MFNNKEKKVIITDDNNYEEPIMRYKSGNIRQIIVGNERIRLMQQTPILKSIPWISGFGWLGTYILFSIIFSMSIRKIMGLA